jgi:hypothetical protein
MKRIINWFWHLPFYKIPFKYKLFLAKVFIRTFRGIGPTFYDDLVLYNELSLWIETEGRPTTSNPNYIMNAEYSDNELSNPLP